MMEVLETACVSVKVPVPPLKPIRTFGPSDTTVESSWVPSMLTVSMPSSTDTVKVWVDRSEATTFAVDSQLS
jgi:hypothetical protein